FMYALFCTSLFIQVFHFTMSPTPLIYTLSLHDALPILCSPPLPTYSIFGLPRASLRYPAGLPARGPTCRRSRFRVRLPSCSRSQDRKSTRLNSSHRTISYAVFCLKKKKNKEHNRHYKRE